MMKNLIVVICAMAMAAFNAPSNARSPVVDQDQQQKIQLICNQDLQDLANECVNAFSEEHPDISVDLLQPGDQDMNKYLKIPGNLAILKKEDLDHLSSRDLRVSVVGREVFVPVMNPDNPFLDEILKKGISPGEFTLPFIAEGSIAWGDVLGNNSGAGLNAYRITDPSFDLYLREFLNEPSGQLNGIVMDNCDAVMHAVSTDRYGIGFCTLAQLQNMQSEHTGLVTAIPVDMNDNNQVDHFEQFYGSVEELSRGVWIGKYPASLYSRIYGVYNQRLLADEELVFLSWLVTDGQQYFDNNGYSSLLENERSAVLAGLSAPVGEVVTKAPNYSRSSGVLVILLLAVGIVLISYLVIRLFSRKRDRSGEGIIRISSGAFRDDPGSVPGGYFFDRSHTWAYMERNGNISIGVDDFLQHVTGSVTRIRLKEPGEKVKRGEKVFSLIQNGKTLDIKSPVSGVIRTYNRELEENPGLINSSPYDRGWIYLIEPDNWKLEMELVFMSENYADWIKKEFERLRDFVMTGLKPFARKEVVLQDGGEVNKGLLEQFGPEAWEEFQTGFLKNK
ncbi:MAG: hypothetical protein K9J30_04620 [Bacteroidales bacterium]|nr:hypothetical protein [Bacteroidales bacterium]